MDGCNGHFRRDQYEGAHYMVLWYVGLNHSVFKMTVPNMTEWYLLNSDYCNSTADWLVHEMAAGSWEFLVFTMWLFSVVVLSKATPYFHRIIDSVRPTLHWLVVTVSFYLRAMEVTDWLALSFSKSKNVCYARYSTKEYCSHNLRTRW
jgi:hypothetical protein